MGRSWSFVPGDEYKSTNRLIHLLVDIVSKGGNFLSEHRAEPRRRAPGRIARPAGRDRGMDEGQRRSDL
ncbi:MAG: alpha-L-fucosidase [Marinilabiliales bacterium]|nr:alpha-L-fucosidase [Marinilabiliales bacterium]